MVGAPTSTVTPERARAKGVVSLAFDLSLLAKLYTVHPSGASLRAPAAATRSRPARILTRSPSGRAHKPGERVRNCLTGWRGGVGVGVSSLAMVRGLGCLGWSVREVVHRLHAYPARCPGTAR